MLLMAHINIEKLGQMIQKQFLVFESRFNDIDIRLRGLENNVATKNDIKKLENLIISYFKR
jgi:hypothetical protein